MAEPLPISFQPDSGAPESQRHSTPPLPPPSSLLGTNMKKLKSLSLCLLTILYECTTVHSMTTQHSKKDETAVQSVPDDDLPTNPRRRQRRLNYLRRRSSPKGHTGETRQRSRDAKERALMYINGTAPSEVVPSLLDDQTFYTVKRILDYSVIGLVSVFLVHCVILYRAIRNKSRLGFLSAGILTLIGLLGAIFVHYQAKQQKGLQTTTIQLAVMVPVVLIAVVFAKLLWTDTGVKPKQLADAEAASQLSIEKIKTGDSKGSAPPSQEDDVCTVLIQEGEKPAQATVVIEEDEEASSAQLLSGESKAFSAESATAG